MRPESLLVAGVPFSPNLGDGLLARCVDEAVAQLGEAVATTFVDLAGRTDFAPTTTTNAGRGRLLTTLASLPRPVGDAIGGTGAYMSTARKFRSGENAAALAVDRPLIIGGGHLLSDEFLNFPAKIALLGQHAAGRAAVALGVGADANPSRSARYLFGRAFRQIDLRMVVARDETTADVVHSIDSSIDVLVAPDLGVLSAHLRPEQPRDPLPNRYDIGVSVASPQSSHYHVGGPRDAAAVRTWWRTLLSTMAADRRILLFSNGSPEDEEFKREIADGLTGGGVAVADTPRTPDDLLELLAASDQLIAQRLHAILPATVAGVGTLSVDPNPKVKAVMATAGLPLHEVSTSTVSDASGIRGVLDALSPADSRQIDVAVDRCLGAVRTAIDRLAE